MLSSSINRPLNSTGYKQISLLLSINVSPSSTFGMAVGHKPYSNYSTNISSTNNWQQSKTSLYSNNNGNIDNGKNASTSTGTTSTGTTNNSGNTTNFQIPGSPIPPNGKVNYFVQPNQQQQQQQKSMFPPLPPIDKKGNMGFPSLPPNFSPNSTRAADQNQSRYHPSFQRQNNNNKPPQQLQQQQQQQQSSQQQQQQSQAILPKMKLPNAGTMKPFTQPNNNKQNQQFNNNNNNNKHMNSYNNNNNNKQFNNNNRQYQQQQQRNTENEIDEDDDDYEEFKAKQARKASQQRSKELQLANEKEIMLPLVPTPKSMSSLTGRSTVEILKWMIRMGEQPTRSDEILNEDILSLLSEDIGVKFTRIKERGEFNIEKRVQDKTWKRKTPVVTIVGHIDHGKTSLLDYLRQTSVVEKEAGRITQHIGAFEVEISNGQKITFMDTPGHAAFSTMRVRGVSTTDIAILIVAADDGVQEQTIEAIKAIHDAKVPYIVAINKIDKPGADVDMVKRQLLEHGVALEGNGGMVPYAEISAKTGDGIEHLEETILLSAEVYDLQASFEGTPEGVVIESTFIKNRGVNATILVKHGIMKVGQFFVCGDTYGKIREMKNHKGQAIKEAPPSTPVEVFGFKLDPPKPGDQVHIVESEQRAKEIIESRNEAKSRMETLGLTESAEVQDRVQLKKGSFKKYQDETGQDKVDPSKLAEEIKSSLSTKPLKEKEIVHKMANLYLKGDVGGSVEALQVALKALPDDAEITYNIVKTGYGDVTEVDLKEVALMKSPLVYFGPKLDSRVCEMAKKHSVPLIESDVIYHVVDNLKLYLESILEPVDVYTITGEAKVQQLFNIDKTNQLEITAAGCKVTNGILKKGSKVRVKRGDDIVHDGKIEIIKHFKELVKEVNKGQECGICIKNFDEVSEGDIIMAYTKSEETRKLGEKVKAYR